MKILTKSQRAVISKDFREITCNKKVVSVIILLPLIMAIILPIIFIVSFGMYSESESSLDLVQIALNIVPVKIQEDPNIVLLYYMLNYIMPVYFLLIPLSTASITAASAIIGEKERNTLETLIFSPLSIRELFFAKATGVLILSMIITFISFCAFLIVSIVGCVIISGHILLDMIMWLVTIFFVVPGLSLFGISLILRISAKAESFQDAQNVVGIGVVPIIFLIISQFAEILVLNLWIVVLIGFLFWVLSFLIIKKSGSVFNAEKLIK